VNVIRRLLWSAGAPVRAMLVGLLLLYRVTVGRLAAGRCRFHPTCSAYALEAVRTHGALKGSALSLWRVLRCSPLTAGGPDPVPEPGTWRRPPDPSVVR
jgi:uncharacterized protein